MEGEKSRNSLLKRKGKEEGLMVLTKGVCDESNNKPMLWRIWVKQTSKDKVCNIEGYR